MKEYYRNEHSVLYQGDCLDVMRRISLCGDTVDMILTDPPYSTPTVASFGRGVCRRLSDLAIQEHYFRDVKCHMESVASDSAPFLIFCDDTYSAVLTGMFYHYKQTGLLIWDKKRIGMGSPYRKRHELIFFAHRNSVPLNKGDISHIPTVLEHPFTKKYHGAEKPISLLNILISGLCPKGGTVLDPFAGSGSTAVAAQRAGRRWVAAELDEEYCEIAAKRLEACHAS